MVCSHPAMSGTELNRIDVDNVINRVKKEVLEQHGVEENSMHKIFTLLKNLDSKMTNAYQFEDELFRLVSFMRDRSFGLSPQESANNSIDRFLNYDIRAPWPNALRRTVLPFLSYTYAFVPVWLRSLSNKPWKIAKIATLGYALQALSYELVPGDEEDERAVMADRDKGWTWAGLPKMLRLPLSQDGDPIYVGMTRVLPGGGLADMDKGQLPMPEWMMISGPMLMAGEFLLNRINYTGQDMVDSVDTNMEATQKRMAYLWRSTMPNAPWIPGSWNFNMLTGSFMGETDIFGREYSPLIATVRQFGPKLYPYDVKAQRTARMMGINKEIQAHKQKIWRLGSDKSRNRISDAAFERGMAQQLEAFKRLGEKAKTYAR